MRECAAEAPWFITSPRSLPSARQAPAQGGSLCWGSEGGGEWRTRTRARGFQHRRWPNGANVGSASPHRDRSAAQASTGRGHGVQIPGERPARFSPRGGYQITTNRHPQHAAAPSRGRDGPQSDGNTLSWCVSTQGGQPVGPWVPWGCTSVGEKALDRPNCDREVSLVSEKE